uniref:histidine kinase n=1 Tax=Chromera velia CCMP2878 TaxID=1169474 RepID=A0A0G4ICR2_9ALVE|eukprot:Cvel_13223.t1-p1 / transcript=Cvel_13223.t1 / gene=Cvel_13223 / organism=Chromera_velia_CCMP2878 / gene_product=Probable chemotaxis protein CheY, putative / transcript_product=Probable chemotaxis protein CheY, putative / location=Cvel_scaffold895:31420-34842(+) / protein_length=766 / sequence_SO=supercontig / SO=protein_coding / is_pseudo=false
MRQNDDYRSVALRRQMEKIAQPFLYYIFPAAVGGAAVFFTTGVASGVGLTACFVGLGILGFAPTLVLKCPDHMEIVWLICLSTMAWCWHIVTSVLPPDAAAVQAVQVNQGATIFFNVQLGACCSVRPWVLKAYIANCLLSFVSTRIYFVEKYHIEDGHPPTIVVALFVTFIAFCLRALSDEAIDVIVETELKTQKAEVERHSFLAYIMHEVRNPLSAACLLMSEQATVIQEMKATASSPDPLCPTAVNGHLAVLEELSATVQRQIDQMGVICDDVLHIEKLTSGTFEYTFHGQDVASFFEDISAETSLVMKQKSIAFCTEVNLPEGACALRTCADFGRLRQVLANFMSNARKFTPSGERVTFALTVTSLPEPPSYPPGSCPHASHLPDALFTTASSLDDTQSDSDQKAFRWLRLRFSVRDGGVGLDPVEDLPKLFKPYQQIRAGEQQNGGGTGLGLCISRIIVESHCGGKIGAISEGKGTGSEFFFEFDAPVLDQSDEDLKVTADEETGEGDDTSNETSPCVSPCRRDDEEAEKHMKKNSTANSNTSITSRFSASSSPLPPAPLSQSAEDDSEAKDWNKLSFPLPPRTPVRARTLGPEPPIQPKENPESRRQSVPTREGDRIPITADVLLVEDNAMCQMAVNLALTRLGYSVRIAEDGEAAVARFSEAGERYRVVLMDRNMPKLEGPEAIGAILEFFKTKSPNEKAPVFVGLTGQTEGAESFLTSGAARVLTKPATTKRIESALEELKIRRRDSNTPISSRRGSQV